MIYFISDHHWGHKAVIWMENRPFKDINEMNQYMIDAWNSVVTDEDQVYHLGDVSYKINPKYLKHNILSKLNGEKHLIIGNHDERILSTISDSFKTVEYYGKLTYQYNDKEYKFVMFHNPIYSWNGIWRGTIHICGHTHTKSKKYYENHPGRIINVSVELLDYKPISIIEVINRVGNKIVTIPNQQ